MGVNRQRLSSTRSLDFVVIGAQKAGTTTLFEHLRTHPCLAIPSSKEASFFNRPELYSRGPEHLISTFFPLDTGDRLLGTVTPDYMCDPGVAPRIADAFPQAKIIAILRDPVERAFSHYRMSVRRGFEDRSFDVAIREQLKPEALTESREQGDDTNSYVVRGEYARILAEYLESFPPEQIQVVFTRDLQENPMDLVRSVQEFLGVNIVAPPKLGEHFLVGSSHGRLPNFTSRLERTPIKRLWHLIPRRHRDLIFHRFDNWNIKPETELAAPESWSAGTEDNLRAVYEPDAELLRQYLGLQVLPWPMYGSPSADTALRERTESFETEI